MSSFIAFNVELADMDFTDKPVLVALEVPLSAATCEMCYLPAEVLIDVTSEIGAAGHDLLLCEPHLVGWIAVHNHKLVPKS